MDEGISPEREDLIRDDPYCAFLGIELISLGSGSARTRLELAEEHLNFHGVPHGGAINSLADAAFAAASNADGDDAFALETNISFLEAVEIGTTLIASAERTHETRSTGEYEVVVTADAGEGSDGEAQAGASDGSGVSSERIATFRGRVYRP